ncbi:GNAT family N-acetyltransferase [Streptomyces sp. NPDC048637]|uniref:GNAT family N-acetyltransferase n=1 Tax=Streptomyces sp. NPDC048637 TaxID=3155636 RepID=UPI00341A4456
MSSLPSKDPWPADISTARLLLRPAESADVEEFTRLSTDPEVRRFLGGPVEEPKLAVYQQHFASRPHVFSVTTRDEATVVGSVSIDPESRFDGRREVSYGFLPEYWGRGYAREAVAAVVDWALASVVSDNPSVIAVTQEANVRSCRLLEAIGMSHIDSFMEFDAPQAMYSVDRQGLRLGQ